MVESFGKMLILKKPFLFLFISCDIPSFLVQIKLLQTEESNVEPMNSNRIDEAPELDFYTVPNEHYKSKFKEIFLDSLLWPDADTFIES